MTGAELRVAGDAVCVALCLVAAIFDVRRRRIPTFLTVPGLCAGLALAAISGGYDLAAAATAAALLGGLFALFAAVGGVGWGDVKLMAAVGALLGWPLPAWPLVLYALVYTALVGGVLAVVVSLRQRRLGAALRGILTMARRRRVDQEAGSGVAIPYGLAIALGALWAVAARYVPALLLG